MNYILFDIEATCWDGYHSNEIQEIIELAAIRFNAFGEYVDEFEQLVQPVINPRISLYCKQLTSISQQLLDAAPTFKTVYPAFKEWVRPDADTYFISWGPFDPKIIGEECQRAYGHPSMVENYIDLRAQYTSKKDLPGRTGLLKAMEYEEIEFEGVQHRAMQDTRNMSVLFKRYFDYWSFA